VDFNVENIAKRINIDCPVLLNEPMSRHTSFRIGGPADLYVRPRQEKDLIALLRLMKASELPVFILGGGANILVSDRGIRGIVVDMTDLSKIEVRETLIESGAGAPVSDLASRAARHGLRGLEFIYRMPGSVGGAVWMNARCYGKSISDLPGWVDFLDGDLEKKRMIIDPAAFAYKKSPFQENGAILLRAGFELEKGDSAEILREMGRIEKDRRKKGHFDLPSAGSVFKNDRALGRPSGMILDELGLKGVRRGKARVSPVHANIIVNTGGATAEDVRALVNYARELAYRELGIILEPEIRFIGEWPEGVMS
jgi:UDP-N-acetylmuramate dehydrogenase